MHICIYIYKWHARSWSTWNGTQGIGGKCTTSLENAKDKCMSDEVINQMTQSEIGSHKFMSQMSHVTHINELCYTST